MKNYVKHLKIISLIFILFSALNVFATSSEIAYHVPDSSKIFNYDNFYISNFSKVDDGTLDNAIVDFSVRSVAIHKSCTIPPENHCNTLVDGYYSSSGNIDRVFLSPENKYDDSYHLTNYFSIYTLNDYSHLSLDSSYQLAIKFSKSSNLDFSHTKINSDDLSIFITNNENPNYINATSFVSNLSANWIVLPDDKDSSKDSNVAILLISFQFNTDDWTQNFTDFSLNHIDIDIGDVSSNHYYVNDDRAFIINNSKIAYNYKINKIYFFENGSFSISGFSDGSSSGSHTSGTGRHDNLDLVYESDYVKIADSEICDSLDIACHLRNIKTKIDNLFIRLGNVFDFLLQGIKDLFVPSSEFMENFTTTNYNLLHTKLGFLLYPFEFLGSFLNGYFNLQRNSIISFNGFTLPNFDVQLIPAFTFDFDSILYSDNFSTLYNYYFIFIDSFIIICFINLCYKKFKEFMGE